MMVSCSCWTPCNSLVKRSFAERASMSVMSSFLRFLEFGCPLLSKRIPKSLFLRLGTKIDNVSFLTQ